MSKRQKSILPPLEFFTGYTVLSLEEILNEGRELEVLSILKNRVILSNISQLKSSSDFEFVNYDIDIIKYNPNTLKVSIKNDREGVFVFRDGFDPNWTVTVNNVRQELIQANYNSKAVFLKSGTNTVEFSFQPKVYICFIFYLSATIGILGLVIIPSFKRCINLYNKK